MIVKRLINQIIIQTKKSILLLGPRQTGKSTLLAAISADLVIHLARENEFLRYSSERKI